MKILKKTLEKITEYKIFEILSLIIAFVALCISTNALVYSKNAYRMASVDYSPCIAITCTGNKMKIVNEDNDLFRIDRIHIVGEHLYHATVNKTEFIEETIPFVLRDFFYMSPSDKSNLDKLVIDLTKRYQDRNADDMENTILSNYNHVIEKGLQNLNAHLSGTEYKLEITYTNKRNHRKSEIYLSYDIDDEDIDSKIKEINSEEFCDDFGNLFDLYDVHHIKESWRSIEEYVEQKKEDGMIIKEYIQ